MGQYVFLSPNANKKLRAILQGTFLHRLFRFSSFDQLSLLFQSFHSNQAVYIRFSHITNFQPKFYIGSTSSTVLDREHTRFRKFLQVQQQKFVLAEVALRFWHRFDNFWMWSILPLFTNNSNFWALEQALIQVWQPRLNTPFIYQFFNCKKGLIAQRPFCSSHQFGTFSLWRKLRWTSTPKRIRATLYSKKFHDRTTLWEVIQHLGTLGSDPTSGYQFPQTISDGETHSIKRVRSPRMLLHSQTRSQLGRTSTILCFECHGQGHSVLERQTSSPMPTFACSMDPVTYMVVRSPQGSTSALRPDASSHNDIPVSFISRGLHQEPISTRQPVQSQRLRYPLGRRGTSSVHLLHLDTISVITNIQFHPHPPGWRLIDSSNTVLVRHRERITTEQNISFQERDLDELAESFCPMASAKWHSSYPYPSPGRLMEHFVVTTSPTAPQPHITLRHHSIYQAVSRGRLPQ